MLRSEYSYKIYVITDGFRPSVFVFSVHMLSHLEYISFFSIPGRMLQYLAIPIDFIVISLELGQSETIRMVNLLGRLVQKS